MTGPRVCPTSIIVLNNPMALPTTSMGTSSLTRAGVEEVTNENPNPYITDRNSRIGNSVEKGIATNGAPLIIQPKIIGALLPILSETLPK